MIQATTRSAGTTRANLSNSIGIAAISICVSAITASTAWSAAEDLCIGDGDGTGTADCRPPYVGQYLYTYAPNIPMPPVQLPGCDLGAVPTEAQAIENGLGEISACAPNTVCSVELQSNPPWQKAYDGRFSDFPSQDTKIATALRTTPLNGNSPCNLSVSIQIYMVRTRPVACPDGYKPNMITTPTWKYCYRPGNRMAFPSCNNPKPGNPIDALNQAKQQVEDDYAAAGASPLRLSRTYYSLGYAQRDPSQPPRPLGNFWRTNYDRTISLHQGSAFPVAYADRPDGSFRWFLNTGGTWQARVDLPERLSQLVDGSGNVTGWRLVTASNEIETYDADGLLLTVQQASGSLQTMRYSDATTLTNVSGQ